MHIILVSNGEETQYFLSKERNKIPLANQIAPQQKGISLVCRFFGQNMHTFPLIMF